MKKFLATYLGSASAIANWKAMDAERREQPEAQGKEAWQQWVLANETAIVDQGSPIGKTKRISAKGIVDARNEIGAYTIVEAETHEAAAKMFENHPHFMIFPGDSVEVMECIPMSKM